MTVKVETVVIIWYRRIGSGLMSECQTVEQINLVP